MTFTFYTAKPAIRAHQSPSHSQLLLQREGPAAKQIFWICFQTSKRKVHLDFRAQGQAGTTTVLYKVQVT